MWKNMNRIFPIMKKYLWQRNGVCTQLIRELVSWSSSGQIILRMQHRESRTLRGMEDRMGRSKRSSNKVPEGEKSGERVDRKVMKFRKANNHSSLSFSEYVTYQPSLKHILQVWRTKGATIRFKTSTLSPLHVLYLGKPWLTQRRAQPPAKPKPTVKHKL